MTNDDKTQNSKKSPDDNDSNELSREEIDQINYERKIRDQQAAGRRVTPWHINIAAVVLCVIGLLYAIPRMLWVSQEEVSDYVPLDERVPEENAEEILPPLPNEQRVFLDDGLENGSTAEPAPMPTPPAQPSVEADPVPGEQRSSSLTTDQQNIEQLLPESEIISTLEQWAQQWSNQNVSGYLDHYASSFISENGQDKAAWGAYREPRIISPEWIEVEITDLEIEFTDTYNAEADFLQIYNASNYSDESFKRLILVRESGQWKIHRELSVDI